jgi:hypothetical protein
VTGMDHHIQLFSDEMEFYEIFCSGWPGTMILRISASCVPGMRSTSHQCPAYLYKS